MQKKIKGFINMSIWMSGAFAVLGLLAIAMPDIMLEIIRWFISIFCLVIGVYLVLSDFSRKNFFPLFSTAALGAIMLIVGLIFAINKDIMNIFSIVIGAWFVVSSVASLRFSAALKGYSGYGASTITAILSLVAGILLIVNPWGSSIAIMTVAGFMMMIYAASNFVDMIILKRNLKDLVKAFKTDKK